MRLDVYLSCAETQILSGAEDAFDFFFFILFYFSVP